MPNLLGNLMLYGWPLIAAALLARLPLERALPWALVGGYLLLPHGVGLNLPLLPTYNKSMAAAIAGLLLCAMLSGGRGAQSQGWRRAGWLPQSTLARILLLLFFVQPVLTVLTNLDPTTSGSRRLTGMSLTDVGAAVYNNTVAIAPFLMARRYLAGAAERHEALKVLAMAGLAYSLLVAFEARFSPQLNNMIYGYRQFDWIQQLRDGGFRPVVFLQHGLWTAIFTATTLVVTATLWRAAEPAWRRFWAAATLWLAVVLAVSNSLGALLLAAVLAPVARFSPVRVQLLTAALLAGIVLSLPILRGVDLFPTTTILAAMERIDPGRTVSLEFRFTAEDQLLARANERPLFGWGGYGRGRVYEDESARTADGRWIITFSSSGWIGYLAEFGLLTLPIFLALRRGAATMGPLAAGLALALSVNLIDMIPNGTLTPITWLLAGVLMGCVEQRRDQPAPQATATERAARRRPGFTRPVPALRDSGGRPTDSRRR